ncbi:Holliday junction resolvase RuvX [Fibrobacter sp. UBA4309]|jgi:putative Holliday junction resolvase|uniref:Holliday junction resolvase RuvX n=1 Tax=Fibrobacter sp. UBA4309 TaxID=1946537 RepID=UPI0025C5869A|nr:Holliday junction resolvase RuvX [Fibrobacter sp. UBA4309]
MNYLALDFGEHRVGVAFADSEFRMAFSRETIDRKTTDLFERLEQLVKINKVDEFVVGMPYRPDGRMDGKNLVVEAFVKELAEHFPGMPIHTQDEAYSSVQAQECTAHFSKKKKQKNKGVIDQLAAAIILQRWLDGQ